MSTAEGILIASASTQQFVFQADISQQLIPLLLFLINYREIPVPLKILSLEIAVSDSLIRILLREASAVLC